MISLANIIITMSSTGVTLNISKSVLRIDKERGLVDFCLIKNRTMNRAHSNIYIPGILPSFAGTVFRLGSGPLCMDVFFHEFDRYLWCGRLSKAREKKQINENIFRLCICLLELQWE